MAINKPTIAAPSVPRADAKHVTVLIITTPVTEPSAFAEFNGELQTFDLTPQREGQMVCYREPGLENFVTMYVAVDVEGTLQWYPVATNTVIRSSTTDNAWNPSERLYSRLAS